MEVESKRKLEAIFARESDRRKAAAEERASAEAKECTRQAEKQSAGDRLPVFRRMLEDVINEMNDYLSGKGLGFNLSEGKRADVALAQIYVQLVGDEAPSKGCQLVLNINAFGRIHPVLLIPHTGRVAKDADLATVTSECLTEMMVEFLDQVLAFADKKGRHL